jgi:hypothetical protein
MGGLVLDIFVVYLIRVLSRAWKQRGTAGWEPTKANIANISSPLITWGCPVVEVDYVYKINDEIYSGAETIPFIWQSSAQGYVQRNPKDSVVTVRIKPSAPETSVMRSADQRRRQVGEERHASQGVL